MITFLIGLFLGLLLAGLVAWSARSAWSQILAQFIADKGLTEELGRCPTVFELVSLYYCMREVVGAKGIRVARARGAK